MDLDYYLIARAEKLGGDHAHTVANLLAIYSLGSKLETPESLRMARKAEKELRSLVTRTLIARFG